MAMDNKENLYRNYPSICCFLSSAYPKPRCEPSSIKMASSFCDKSSSGASSKGNVGLRNNSVILLWQGDHAHAYFCFAKGELPCHSLSQKFKTLCFKLLPGKSINSDSGCLVGGLVKLAAKGILENQKF